MAQTKALVSTTVQSLLLKTSFIVPIAGTVGEMVDRAVVEYRLGDMKEASMKVTDDDPSIKCSPSRAKRPSNIPSDSKSREEPRPSRRHHCISSVANAAKKGIETTLFNIQH